MAKSYSFLLKFIRTKFKILSKVSKQATAKEAFALFCTPLARITHDPLNLLNAESLSFEMNGTIIKGFRWQKGGAPKVLLIHGFSSSVANFHHFAELLSGLQYEVLGFDAPGHGISGGKQLNAVVYADMIKKIIREYGPIENFISHSFGGLAVCLALEEQPQSASTKIVLIAPATETTTAINSAFKMIQIADQKVRQEFDKLIMNISGKNTEWYSIKRALKNVRAKVLWLHDKDDNVTPLSDAQAAYDELNDPALQFIITKGLGHRRIYRDPGIIKTVCSFLTEGDTRSSLKEIT